MAAAKAISQGFSPAPVSQRADASCGGIKVLKAEERNALDSTW